MWHGNRISFLCCRNNSRLRSISYAKDLQCQGNHPTIAGLYEFGIFTPDDKWVLTTTQNGITEPIGTYQSDQRFGYKLKSSDGTTYYSDPKMNPDGVKHASIFDLSDGREWISWRGITGKYSSDVVIEVTPK